MASFKQPQAFPHFMDTDLAPIDIASSFGARRRASASTTDSPPAAKRRRVMASAMPTSTTDAYLQYGNPRKPMVLLSKYCRRVRRLVLPFLAHIDGLAIEVQEFLSATWFDPCVKTNFHGAEVLALLPFPLARPLEPKGYTVLDTKRDVAESLAATNRSIQAMKTMQALVSTGLVPLPPGLLLFQGVICRPKDSAGSTKGFIANGMHDCTSSGADSLHGLAVGDSVPAYMCVQAYMHLSPATALLTFADRTDSACASRQPWMSASEAHKTDGLRGLPRSELEIRALHAATPFATYGEYRRAQRLEEPLKLDTLVVHVFDDDESRRPNVSAHVVAGAQGYEPLDDRVGRVTVTGPWHSVITQKLIVDVGEPSSTSRPIGTRSQCGCVCVLVVKSSCV